MKTYTFYFSPTGGTKKILDIFTEGWQIDGEVDLSKAILERKADQGAELLPGADVPAGELPQLTAEDVPAGELPQFTSEDICIVAVPSFGGRVPAAALERVLKIPGNGASAVLIVSFGNRAYEDTLLELQEEMETNGYVVKAAMAAVAEHSIMHQFGAGRPDKADAEEIREFSGKVAETFRNRKKPIGQTEDDKGGEAVETVGVGENVSGTAGHQRNTKLTIPGNHPYKPYGVLPMQPEAGEACTGCGICANGCPVGAIDKADPKCTDKEKCISCMRCVELCPKHARKVNSDALKAAVNKLQAACESRKKNEFFMNGK